ncbi:MAG: hypothetical protein FWC86_05125 [Coriobacteriia bacterium]|nr:hypothetical protein [Coriobacteriia bacterium]
MQQPQHQPPYLEEKKKFPAWATALIVVGVLAVLLFCSSVIALVTVEAFSGGVPARLFTATEAQEEPSPDIGRTIESPTSPTWEAISDAFADVMDQNNILPSGPWGPDGTRRTSSFVDFTGVRDGQNVSLTEFGTASAANREYEQIQMHLLIGNREEIAGNASEGFSYNFFDAGNQMYGTVILFGNYIFEAFVNTEDHERHIVPLIEDLQYLTMTELPEDPVRDFREAVLAIGHFGDYDSGHVQSIVFHDQEITATLYEKHDESGKADFLERLLIREPTEYEIVQDGSYVHYWAIEYWWYDMYLVSIYHQNFLYQFISPAEHRERIDEIVSQLIFLIEE